jgi:hypothetical protein
MGDVYGTILNYHNSILAFFNSCVSSTATVGPDMYEFTYFISPVLDRDFGGDQLQYPVHAL